MTPSNPPVLVPIAEVNSIPIFFRSDALFDWLRARKVVVHTDFNDRPAITLSDAYLLQAEGEAEAKAEEARRHAAAEKLRADVDKAQRRRQEVYTSAYLDACRALPAVVAGSVAIVEARQKAWKSVLAAEKGLPVEVSRNLGPVSLDGLPGAPNFHLCGATLVPRD